MNKDVKLQVFPVVCTDRVSIIAKSAGWPQFGGKRIQGLIRDFQLPFPYSFQRCFTTSESVYDIIQKPLIA